MVTRVRLPPLFLCDSKDLKRTIWGEMDE
jgi:hypothetical protein